MTQRILTGGLKQFIYPKGHQPKLNEKEKKEIEEAYQRYYERKRKEKIRRAIGWMLFIILLLILSIIIFFR